MMHVIQKKKKKKKKKKNCILCQGYSIYTCMILERKENRIHILVNKERERKREREIVWSNHFMS